MTEIALRPPDQVLRLDRMGSFHQTRLSFMRVLLRRLAREKWSFERVRWNIGARGEGIAVYEARGPHHPYSLVAFGHDLDPAKRTDRVIAEEWDATFALHDGPADDATIERLSRNVPKQEAGRCTAAELVMARANRSVRIFDHLIETLAAGRQPSPSELDAVGYLMRNTAVYGSGKFGLSDYRRIADRPEFSGPFAAEMLTVWLIRAFTADLVEHLAQLRAPATAVRLDPHLRRRLGVGNSTGLGMAPFVVNHPSLFHRWMLARETAIGRVRAIKTASSAKIAIFHDRLVRGIAQMESWNVDDTSQMSRIVSLRADLVRLKQHVAQQSLSGPSPWDRLHRWGKDHLGLEAQEFLVTLLLEPYGSLVDDLAHTMASDEASSFRIDGSMPLGDLMQQIEFRYGDAIATDFAAPENQARFWYTSEEKLEPRLGERAKEEGAERELPLAVARDIARLHAALVPYSQDCTVADFLARHPEHRHALRRVQLAARMPYAEIRDNIVSAAMRPIDILRCKLSFFGATDFDPRSDRWVRISMYRHAPFPDELHGMDPDDWAIPPLEPPILTKNDPPLYQCGPSSIPIPQGYTLNEIEAQIRKAARGAGLPWGLAEEAGKAARLIATRSPSQLTLLAGALEDFESGRQAGAMDLRVSIFSSPDSRPLSPFILGPALADHATAFPQRSFTVASPIAFAELVVPYLAAIPARLVMQSGNATLTPACEPSSPTTIPASVAIPAELWRRFDRLAFRTYVPASATSRLSGAGAGALTDND